MKFSTILSSLFLLFAFTSCLPSTRGQVFDTDGEVLQNPGVYHILPSTRGLGGGIEQAATGNETCPLTVVQSNSIHSRGLQVAISSVLRIPFILDDSDLDFSFASFYLCAPNPKWTLVGGLPEGPSVKLLGYENRVAGAFRIRAVGFGTNSYKLVFCASSSGTCTDIGVHVDKNGVWRLVATDNNPLLVGFRKPGTFVAAV